MSSCTELPSALAGLGTGVVLLLFARRVAGFWVGLLAFLAWTLLPHGFPVGPASDVVKVERLALLDPIAGLFMILASYFGWRWAETGMSRWALLAGVAVGLATGSKATGVLILPVVVVGAILIRRVSRRSIAQGATVVAVCATAALATYLPLGRQAPEAIKYMFAFQARHASGGHPMIVAGDLYLQPPWWSHLWWQWLNYGTITMIALAVGLSVSLLLRPRPFFLYIWVAVLVPFVYLSFFTGFKLAHYYYLWQPPLTLLVAVAVGRLIGMADWRRVAGIGILAPLACAGGVTVGEIATLQPRDYHAAAKLLRAHHATDGTVVVYGYRPVARTYLPGTHVVGSPRARQGPVEAVIDDPAYHRWLTGRPGREHRAYLERIRPNATRYRVDRLDVYLLNGSVAGD